MQSPQAFLGLTIASLAGVWLARRVVSGARRFHASALVAAAGWSGGELLIGG